MNIPAELKYTADHEWIRIEGNTATIGITDFAQSELGDIVFVDINTKGKSLKSGEIFGTVEAVKTVSDLFLPIDGTIDEVNPNLESIPESVNKDPYGEGWMVRITLSGGADGVELMDADKYKALVGA
ncbi:MAG: glycine cleavage system protein GcvH [Chitinophagaceae bacterium]